MNSVIHIKHENRKSEHLLLISNSKTMRGNDTSCVGCDAMSLYEYILAFQKNCSAFIFSRMMLNASELRIFQCQYLLAQQYSITAPRRPVPLVTPLSEPQISQEDPCLLPTSCCKSEFNANQSPILESFHNFIKRVCEYERCSKWLLHFSKVLMGF